MILPEYRETVFIDTPPVAGWPSDFHIITAWNPKRIVSESQNHEADARLRAQLTQKQIEHFPITGCSADLAHQAVEALKGTKTLQELAKEYDLHPVQISDWKQI